LSGRSDRQLPAAWYHHVERDRLKSTSLSPQTFHDVRLVKRHMKMRLSHTVSIALLFCSLRPGHAQSANPDSARLVTRDIPNFWRAIDRASGKDTAALIAAIREEYLSNPSPGLSDWIVNRLIDQGAVGQVLQAKGWDRARSTRARSAPTGSPERAGFDSVVMPAVLDNAAKNLAWVYLHRRAYYDAIRSNTLAVDTARAIKDSIHASFRRLSALDPDAKFTDVYFLIGRMNSGGTTAPSGLLIGTEINGRDASTPVAELSPWERAVTGQIKDLPHIVAHEMIHTLQGPRTGPRTLLASALDEGSADFLAELISGKHIINPAYTYGDAHESELWSEFKAAMDSTNMSAWMYQGDRAPPGRPADLGYWMGYKISKAYYDRASDKRAAVKDILLYTDAKAFLAASGYGR
jgi:predicted Zn-dependent protease DUF2268